jgi:hypothetical protein
VTGGCQKNVEKFAIKLQPEFRRELDFFVLSLLNSLTFRTMCPTTPFAICRRENRHIRHYSLFPPVCPTIFRNPGAISPYTYTQLLTKIVNLGG